MIMGPESKFAEWLCSSNEKGPGGGGLFGCCGRVWVNYDWAYKVWSTKKGKVGFLG